MDPAATVPGPSRPLVTSESEASIASQLLPMEGGDSEMLSLASVSEPAVQQDSPKEYAEEDLVSQILVDNDSEMADAESLVESAMEPTNPPETPPHSDDTVEHATISTSDKTGEPTATDLPSAPENQDTVAESNDVSLQNTTTSTDSFGIALEADIDASTLNHGAISKDRYDENAGASSKMALSNILDSQATNDENEDDDEGDMSSELSEGGDLQVSFYIMIECHIYNTFILGRAYGRPQRQGTLIPGLILPLLPPHNCAKSMSLYRWSGCGRATTQRT